MTQCGQCGSSIPDDDSTIHYLVSDVSTEIISIIEQQKGAAFTNLNDEICQMCFTNATETLCKLISYKEKPKVKRGRPIRRSLEPKQVQLHNAENETSTSRIVCVYCQSSLYGKTTHALPDGPQRNLISDIIHPRKIPPRGLVCLKCWIYVSRVVGQKTEKYKGSNGANNQTYPDNACVRCLYSLSNKRKHILVEGPIRDEIAARISPRQIPEGGLVCYSCWSAARQYVERRQKKEPSQEEALEPIEEPSQQETEKTEYVTLSNYHRLRGDYTSCAAGCTRMANRAPLAVRSRLLANQNVYLPGLARLCDIHCHPDAVLTFHKPNLSNKFTGDQIADTLFLMKRPKPLDADDVDAMDQHVRRMWLGVTWEGFLAKAHLNPSIPRRAVAIRLCAMTSGECPEVLASLFQLPRKEIDDALTITKHLDHTKQNGPHQTVLTH